MCDRGRVPAGPGMGVGAGLAVPCGCGRFLCTCVYSSYRLTARRRCRVCVRISGVLRGGRSGGVPHERPGNRPSSGILGFSRGTDCDLTEVKVSSLISGFFFFFFLALFCCHRHLSVNSNLQIILCLILKPCILCNVPEDHCTMFLDKHMRYIASRDNK